MIWLAVLLLFSTPIAYWGLRGLTVFRKAMVEYQPTNYAETEAGRRTLAHLLEVARPVQWRLSDGSVQKAYFVPGGEGPGRGAAIVYAHGSPGTGAGLLPEALALQRSGYAGLLIDLPGYGDSEGGRRWDDAFLESLRAGVDFALGQPGIDPNRVGVHGYSNGGCLAARAAADDPRISAVALVAAYTNLRDQLEAQHRQRLPGMPWFAIAAASEAGVPIADLDSERALRSLGERPTLIIGGGRDRQIPRAMTERLQSAPIRAEMTIFEDAKHIGFPTTIGEPYLRLLESFWNRSLPRDPAKGSESRSLTST
jgi:dipeptidyl aminopeptidase/acylaminoacyl peptidase